MNYDEFDEIDNHPRWRKFRRKAKMEKRKQKLIKEKLKQTPKKSKVGKSILQKEGRNISKGKFQTEDAKLS